MSWWTRPASALAAATLVGCDLHAPATGGGVGAPPALDARADDTDAPEAPSLPDDTHRVPSDPLDDPDAARADTFPFDPPTDDTDRSVSVGSDPPVSVGSDPPVSVDSDTSRADTSCTGLLRCYGADTGPGRDTG